jgi:hypothetical protein
MGPKKIVRRFWGDIDARRWDNLAAYFYKKARIELPNTGERFNALGFRDLNSNSPGYWHVEIEKIIRAGRLVISVVKVANNASSFHATSFFTFRGKKILSLLEYWGEDDGPYRRHVKNVPKMIEAASDLPADGEGNEGSKDSKDIEKAGEPSEPSETGQTHEARQDNKPRHAHKEADIVTMPQAVKKSAWTRLFFPDDAV